MADDLALFGDDPKHVLTPSTPAATPISDWQIDLLRKALDGKGLHDMGERQRAIESAALRPVPSLRDLTHDEALRVITRLGTAPRASSGASAWDERGDDTWIDRL